MSEDDLWRSKKPLEVMIDGTVAVLMRTPGYEKELAVGFCLSEGILDDFGQIGLVSHCGSLGLPGSRLSDDLDISRNIVRITLLPGASEVGDRRLDVMRLVRSGCGRTSPAELVESLRPVASELRVEREVLRGLFKVLVSRRKRTRSRRHPRRRPLRRQGGRSSAARTSPAQRRGTRFLGIASWRASHCTQDHIHHRARSYEDVLEGGATSRADRRFAVGCHHPGHRPGHRLQCTLVGYLRRERHASMRPGARAVLPCADAVKLACTGHPAPAAVVRPHLQRRGHRQRDDLVGVAHRGEAVAQ